MTGGALVAGGAGAVVDVLAAVVPGPAVHAHALVTAVRVVARPAVLARVGHQQALVDVLSAELTCEVEALGSGGVRPQTCFADNNETIMCRPVNSGLHWQL